MHRISLSSFLAHKSINFLNAHYAIRSLADNLAGIFVLVYLYQNGLSLWQVFVVLAGTIFLRAVIRPLSLWLVMKNGLKASLIIGTISYAGLFQVIYLVRGVDVWLFIFMIYHALNDTLYWLPYHAYYSSVGRDDDTGKHLGMRESLVAAGSAFVPALGGLLIMLYNFYVVFAAATVLVLVSIIPILKISGVSYGKNLNFREAFGKVSKTGFWLFVGDGFYTVGFYFIWPMIVFLLFNSYITYGWLFTVSLVSQSLGFLIIGKLADDGHQKNIYKTAVIFGSLVTIGQAFFGFSLGSVLFLSFAGALVKCFYMPPLAITLYNSARTSKNVLWFHFFAENGWDAGAVIILLIAALFTYNNIGLRPVLVISILGLLVVGFVIKSCEKIRN